MLQSISVSPDSTTVPLGSTQQFKAEGTFSDGSTRDLTAQASWSSSSSAVANVTGGLARAVGMGSTQIQATFDSVAGSTTLKVTTARVTQVAVSPVSPQIFVGLSQQFTATAIFSDGTSANVTGQAIWSSSSSGVATVSGGLARGVGAGSAQIQATISSTSGAATLNVIAAQLTSLSVTPGQASVVLNAWGQPPTQQYQAIGTFNNGLQQDISSAVQWSISPSSVATLSTAGLASVLATGTATVTASRGPISSSGILTVTTGLEKLRHIIFLVQENRTFDNYFSVLGSYRASKVPGALPTDVDDAENMNPQPQLLNGAHQLIGRYHFRTVCHDNLSAGWFFSHDDVASGMKDFLINAARALIPAPSDPDGDRPLGYYDETDLPYYYELATQFATSDRMFAPLLGPTAVNRMYLFAGTSFGWFEEPTPTKFPATPTPPYPPTPPTIFDKLDLAGVTWRNYYHDNNHVFIRAWPGFYNNTSQYQSSHAVPIYTTNPNGTVADPIGRWKADLQNESTLPQVIFIERGGCSPDPNKPGTCTDIGVTGTDEHPGANIQVGAADTANIINTLMESPAWDSSVFIVVFDEGGGTYDHVPAAAAPAPDNIPPTFPLGTIIPSRYRNFNQTGFRVPNLIVSPWVRPQFVSHTARDTTSILRLIEDRFGLQPLSNRDAAWDDLREFFDFSSPHLLSPPPLPPQPATGVCSYAAETP